jgi:hypothetical protein
MVLGGPSEKDIEEMDESERSSHSHESGVYVFFTSLLLDLTCKSSDVYSQSLPRPRRLRECYRGRVAVHRRHREPAWRQPPARDSWPLC